MSAPGHFASLRRSTDGSMMVEFALLGPMMIAMLLAVLQFGLGMQNYNALRSAAADVGREVAVEYQKANLLTNGQIQSLGRATAIQAPYLLDSDSLVITVQNAATQRVSGARELTLTLTYTVPSVLAIMDLPSFNIDYSRPIFVKS